MSPYDLKRLVFVCGHYGSGKTNFAVNLAVSLKKKREKVAIADLDIVNPYFRTKDSLADLEQAGVRLICSEYANTNLDIPALPDEMYLLTDDRSYCGVIDVGGDERGALALGRIAPSAAAENNYDMLAVINCYRPLSSGARDTIEILGEIERACGLRFTGLVNNSNLGPETDADTFLKSIGYAEEISGITGLPVMFNSVSEKLYSELSGRVDNLFPMRLQKNLPI